MARKIFSIVAFASALTLIASINGLAASVVTVSQEPSPLAGCPNDSQPGRNYPSAEVEPQLAVFGDKMIAQWHQDRWSNGGGHGIGVGISKDRGSSWTQSVMPWDACTSTDPSLTKYQRNSDPWVSFGPDGTAYASALAFNIAVPNWANAVVVATLPKGTTTWQNVKAIPGSAFSQFNQSTDKNSTTADPTTPGTAYTVWDTLFEPTDQPDDNPHTASYTGPAYFSMITKGTDWTPAKIIVNTAQRQQTIGNIIVVDPTTTPHTLYDFMNLIVAPNTPKQGTRSNQQVAFVKSTDGGSTWTQPQIIAPFNSLGVHDPNTGAPLRTGDGLEEVARDPSTGRLYVVWQSSTNYVKNVQQGSGSWDDEILLTSSGDGGASWSSPTVVHQAGGMPTYTPTIAVNGNRVAISYYDNRNLPAGDMANLPTDYWVSISTGGGPFVEQHLAGPFDEMSAPVARGFFLGDYEGLQPSGTGFEALFVTTNCQPPYTGANCGPASNSVTPNPNNTNPTDVFAVAIP